MNKALFRIVLAATLVGCTASSALAGFDGPWGRPAPHFIRVHDRRDGPDWGHDRYRPRAARWPGFRGPAPWVHHGMPAWDHWHHGYWHYATYGGRLGWWWIVDGYWYLYPTRVMPYPDYYTTPAVVMQSGVPIAVQPAPVVVQKTETYISQTPPPGTTTVTTTAPPPEQAPSAAPASSGTYTNEQGQTCREYQSTIMVGGQKQNAYGTVCLQPDGTWRIVK